MATNFQFYETMFTQLGSALTGYVNSTATNIIGAITPVATTLLTIYVMLWGWSMIRGVIQEPVIDGFNRMIRLTLITTAALGIGYYNGYIADFLWNTPDALATYVAGGASYTSTSSGAYLDDLMSQMWDFGDAYYQKYETTSWMGIPNSFFFLAYAIWGAAIIATGYAAFLFALSKMALAIILAVGPIFVLLTMFEPTKRFFDAWIGQALNYVFLVMLTAGAVKLIYAIPRHCFCHRGLPGDDADAFRVLGPGRRRSCRHSWGGVLGLRQGQGWSRSHAAYQPAPWLQPGTVRCTHRYGRRPRCWRCATGRLPQNHRGTEPGSSRGLSVKRAVFRGRENRPSFLPT